MHETVGPLDLRIYLQSCWRAGGVELTDFSWLELAWRRGGVAAMNEARTIYVRSYIASFPNVP